jgi:hypothetical protein
LWTAKEEGTEEEKGKKEGKMGGRGERKVLGGARDSILALCAATMDSRVPVHASPCGWICSAKTQRGPRPAAAAQRTVFSERRTGESSLRGAAALAACAAQPSSRDARFELAAGPRQLRKLRGPVSRSDLGASRSELGSRAAQPRGQVRLDWNTRKVRATCSVVRLHCGCVGGGIFLRDVSFDDLATVRDFDREGRHWAREHR